MESNTKKVYYECKITLGKDMNGKLIRKSIYSKKSKADARKKAERYRANYELEIFCSGEGTCPKVRFETWSTRCLEMYKKPYVKGNTYSGTYLAPVQQRLDPWFGKMYLEDILPIHVQKYINHLGDTYSPESIKKDFTVLSFILQHAVDNGLCKSNPAKKSIHLPKVEPPEKQTYTQTEYDTAFAFAKEHPDGLSIMLLMETGITRSELLGLRWEDLNLEENTISINQGLVGYQDLTLEKWVVESGGLKNKYRRRTIPLVDPTLIQYLERKPRTIILPAEEGEKPQKIAPQFIFHSPQGLPYQPQNWSRRIFKSYTRDLAAAHPELPVLTPHELRHTRATL